MSLKHFFLTAITLVFSLKPGFLGHHLFVPFKLGIRHCLAVTTSLWASPTQVDHKYLQGTY